MTPSPQQEYIITDEYIEKLDEWLSEHGIDELQRMQIRVRLRLDPRPSPAPTEKDRIFALLSDPETRKEVIERLSQPWSIEVVKEIERIRKQHEATIVDATLDEAIKIVNAFERKPKYDYEVTTCLLITQSLEALKEKVEERDLK